jgi:16S rRNA G1207 methylase RsmC
MPRRTSKRSDVTLADVPTLLAEKLRGPLAVLMGNTVEVLPFLAALPRMPVTCYHLDVFPAERLRQELREVGLDAEVVTAPDLWDLPANFETVVYPAPLRGHRDLKIDLVEQAFHILKPRGSLVVCTPYAKDLFFPALLKKIFGRVHAPSAGRSAVYWARREGDRPRRRHEVAFQVRGFAGVSHRFLSRPGTFSYGRFDAGARALVESARLDQGESVLDIGCGCGTNGVLAADLTGSDAEVGFVDSNVRAIALTEHNARANGLTNFRTSASASVEGWPPGHFDVALANPPYFAHEAVGRLFIERSRKLLKPNGRFYLVTKQPGQVGDMFLESFGHAEALVRRGYTILASKLGKAVVAADLFRPDIQLLEEE